MSSSERVPSRAVVASTRVASVNSFLLAVLAVVAPTPGASAWVDGTYERSGADSAARPIAHANTQAVAWGGPKSDIQGGPPGDLQGGLQGIGSGDAANLHTQLATPQVRAALERGLAFLAQAQARTDDGSLPRLEAATDVTVALTALGALAFMAGGSTPERGPHAAATARAIDFLLARSDLSESPTHGYISAGASEPTARMHGHGFAALALAQAFTMAPSGARGERIARVLEAAVRRIEASQSVEGGWFYSPLANIEHENSVTVVQLQALRAAHNCGVRVDPRVIRTAVDYIVRCQSDDGAFRYALGPEQKTSVALTAAGLATMQSAGVYEGPAVQRATDALWRRLVARAEGQERAADFPHYERLYVGIALWTMVDQRGFARWFEPTAASLVREQRPDGGWGDERYGACYATAMNCLVLSIPDGLLPLFER